MATIGQRNILTVLRDTPPGLILDGEELGDILLPGRYIPRGTVPEDTLDVFLYLDSEDRLVATTETPHAMVGEFAAMKVISIHQQAGAFLDWGLSKDLLLPFREQPERVEVGDTVVVYVNLDPRTNRIVATMKLDKYLSRETPPFEKGEEVSLLIAGKTPLGYNAIVEPLKNSVDAKPRRSSPERRRVGGKYGGLLYHTNLSGPLQIGQKLQGFVHSVRDDRKIDLRLDASGYQRVAPLKDKIVAALRNNKGRIEFDNDSPPEKIRAEFGASKKAFKMALGALYKERKIQFVKAGVEFVKKA